MTNSTLHDLKNAYDQRGLDMAEELDKLIDELHQTVVDQTFGTIESLDDEDFEMLASNAARLSIENAFLVSRYVSPHEAMAVERPFALVLSELGAREVFGETAAVIILEIAAELGLLQLKYQEDGKVDQTRTIVDAGGPTPIDLRDQILAELRGENDEAVDPHQVRFDVV